MKVFRSFLLMISTAMIVNSYGRHTDQSNIKKGPGVRTLITQSELNQHIIHWSLNEDLKKAREENIRLRQEILDKQIRELQQEMDDFRNCMRKKEIKILFFQNKALSALKAGVSRGILRRLKSQSFLAK